MSEKGQRGPRGGPTPNLPPIPPETMTMNIQLNMQHAAMQQTMRMMNIIREYCFMGCPRNNVAQALFSKFVQFIKLSHSLRNNLIKRELHVPSVANRTTFFGIVRAEHTINIHLKSLTFFLGHRRVGREGWWWLEYLLVIVASMTWGHTTLVSIEEPSV